MSVKRFPSSIMRNISDESGDSISFTLSTIAFTGPEVGKGLLGQHEADGVADFAELKFQYHRDSVATDVITSSWGKGRGCGWRIADGRKGRFTAGSIPG